GPHASGPTRPAGKPPGVVSLVTRGGLGRGGPPFEVAIQSPCSGSSYSAVIAPRVARPSAAPYRSSSPPRRRATVPLPNPIQTLPLRDSSSAATDPATTHGLA